VQFEFKVVHYREVFSLDIPFYRTRRFCNLVYIQLTCRAANVKRHYASSMFDLAKRYFRV
jgi:hypothetical protein